MCCKLKSIPELKKPHGKWCAYIAAARGCAIYRDRPLSCRAYQCGWTLTQSLDIAWRPDNAKFLLDQTGTTLVIEVDADTPQAWRREPFYTQIKAWSRRAPGRVLTTMVRVAGEVVIVFPEADIAIGPYREDIKIDSGYETRGGRHQPYARYLEPTTPQRDGP